MELLLYAVDAIWVVDDLFSLAHTLKSWSGALVQCAVSGLLLMLLMYRVSS